MNSLYDSEIKKMKEINPKEEIETLLDKLETELTNLPLHDPEQRKYYKFGQYITGLTNSVNEAIWTFQKLQKKVTDLLSEVEET